MIFLQRLFLLLALLLPLTAHAQLSLTVDSVDASAFPDIDVQVVAARGSLLLRDLDSSAFKLREDQFLQGPLRLTYPGATQNFSVVFVISNGALMTESNVETAKGIVDRILDWMDGFIDEAALFAHSDASLGPIRDMTSDPAWLRIGLNSVQRTSGGTHLWDGANEGARYCLANGIQGTRAMVLLSNGKADGGQKTVTDVVTTANLGNIKVYTIGISAVNSDQDLKLLAQQTGGEYFGNGDLAVQEIGLALTGRPRHAVLSYTTDNLCRDGIDRQLDVQVRSQNDSITTSHTGAITADPSTNVGATLKPENAGGTAGDEILMPFAISGSVAGQRFFDGVLTFAFDTSKIRLADVDTTGSMGKFNGYAVDHTADGATVTVTGASPITGPGTLCMLVFRAANLGSKTDVPVALASAMFSRGCLDVTTGSGTLTVNPKQYKLTLSANPVIFNWDAPSMDYIPNPGEVQLTVKNDGDLAVTGLTATLAENDGVRIAYGAGRTVNVSPSTLDPGQSGTATWYVQALPRPAEGTERVNAEVVSVEGARADKDLFLNIKAANLGLRFSDCKVSDISTTGGSYAPKPAVVSTDVLNAGSADTPAGDVTIVLPASGELTLTSGAQTQPLGALTAGASASFNWEIDYPSADKVTAYAILLVRTATGLENDTCRLTLTVPPLTESALEMSCSHPDFSWNPTTASYDPNPGVFTMTVNNNGPVDSDPLRAVLVLPDGLVLADGEIAERSHGPLEGGGSWQESWQVEVETVNCGDAVPVALTVHLDIGTAGDADSCISTGTVGSANTAPPEVHGTTPDMLDTLMAGAEQSFSVDASDPDGSQLSWSWNINGVRFPSTTNSMTHTFSQTGTTTVRCTIVDECAAAGEGDSTFVSWTFEVVEATSVARVPGAADRFTLLGNYPNPFNPGTTIGFTVPAGEHNVTVDVLDTQGRVVAMLSDGRLQGGRYESYFDASALPSGSYFLRLRAADVQLTSSMLLLK